MKTLTYKNITTRDLVLVGVGVISAGKTIGSPVPLNNPHLELVETRSNTKAKQEKK